MTESPAAGSALQLGRDAFSRYAWREAFEQLTATDAAGELSAAEDLEHLSQAAMWCGRMDEAIAIGERAYAAYVREGNGSRAANAALDLSDNSSHRLAHSAASAWLKRAERLLENEPECRGHGLLARHHMNAALGEGDSKRAYEQATRILEVGDRLADRDLQALGLHDQGLILIGEGQVKQGMALLDEAAVAAVGGELSPWATAVIYCNLISACRNLADYRRAGEWTEAAKRWCERQAITGFPGRCRVFRAEIMRLRGAWQDAEREARDASTELRNYSSSFTAEAFNELGEIRLRMGDLAAAEEAFRQAHELGCDPQPGLAVLRALEGKLAAASSSIKRALGNQPHDRLARARLLPAQVDIAVESADLETARAAATELEETARDFGTSALKAAAACARGALELAERRPVEALQALRTGVRLWQEVDAPYEAARARIVMASAYVQDDCRDDAVLELQAARTALDRLGAQLDARRAAEMLERLARPGDGRAAPESKRATKAFMFIDIVESTPLLEAIGDEAWDTLLSWHEQTLRSLFIAHGGEEISQEGDGFFVVFPDAAGAAGCAVAIQRSLSEHRREHGFAPQVRIGLHEAEATRRGHDYSGKGVNTAARIASLAAAGDILASHASLAADPEAFAFSAPRAVSLKGISQPVEIVSIEWR